MLPNVINKSTGALFAVENNGFFCSVVGKFELIYFKLHDQKLEIDVICQLETLLL